MLTDIYERIERRLAATNKSASAAAIEAGLSKDGIRNIQRAIKNGRVNDGVSSETLLKLAPVLETTPSWLLDGYGPETDSASTADLLKALTIIEDRNLSPLIKAITELNDDQLTYINGAIDVMLRNRSNITRL